MTSDRWNYFGSDALCCPVKWSLGSVWESVGKIEHLAQKTFSKLSIFFVTRLTDKWGLSARTFTSHNLVAIQRKHFSVKGRTEK